MAHSTAGAVIAAIGAASGGSGVAFLTYLLKRREVREAAAKNMADTASKLTETALKLLEPVSAAAAKAEEQARTMQARIVELESAVASAVGLLTELTERYAAERKDLLKQIDDLTADLAAERERLAKLLAAAGPDAA